MKTTKDTIKDSFTNLKEKLGYSNPMQSPKIEKVVITTGTGSTKDKKKIEIIQDRLARITGQKPAATVAKQSIAGFKLREGNVIGYKVTLRGDRMSQFLDRLIHVALPRTRDFRGLKLDAIDEMGNYTLGIKEHTIFPETSDEELKNVFGMGITIVTTAKTKKETEALLREIGLPLQKND